jgi:prophage DNA circulation protein
MTVNTGPVYYGATESSTNNGTSSPTVREQLKDIQGSIKAVADNTSTTSNAVVALEKGVKAMRPHKPPSQSSASPAGMKYVKVTLFEEPLEDRNYWQTPSRPNNNTGSSMDRVTRSKSRKSRRRLRQRLSKPLKSVNLYLERKRRWHLRH